MAADLNRLRLDEAALAWARRGVAVFPCRPGGKEPLGELAPHGVHDATLDMDRIRWWWRRCPEANIGGAGGHGLLWLDVDVQHGGHLSLLEAEEEQGPLPDGLWQFSGTVTEDDDPLGPGIRSRHYALQLPDTMEADLAGREIAPGLDVRGPGKYVILAPSLHPNGRQYELAAPLETDIAIAPGWIIERLEPHRADEERPELPCADEVSFPLPAHTAAKLVRSAWMNHRPNRREALAYLSYMLRHAMTPLEQAHAILLGAAELYCTWSEHVEPFDARAWIEAKLRSAWRQTPQPGEWRLGQILRMEVGA